MSFLKNSSLSVKDSLFKPKIEEIVNKPGYHFKIEQSFWSLVKEVQKRHIFSVNGQIIDLKDNMETEQGEIYSLYLYSLYLWRHGALDFAISLSDRLEAMVVWSEYDNKGEPVYLRNGNTTIEMSRIDFYRHFQTIDAAKGYDDAAVILSAQRHLAAFPKDIGARDNISVFTFRRCSEYMFNDLEQRGISVTNPTEMNDLWDSLAYNMVDARKEEMMKQVISKFGVSYDIAERYSAYFDIEKKVLSHYRIRSFVAGDTDEPLSNRLLWAHYADSWKGICIKYSLSPFFQYSKDDFSIRMMRKVDYLPKSKKLDYKKQRITEMFFRKEDIWAYENELRLLTFSKYNDEKYERIPLDEESRIEAVYFGVACSEDNKKKIRELLSYDTSIQLIDMDKDSITPYQTNESVELNYMSKENMKVIQDLFGE